MSPDVGCPVCVLSFSVDVVAVTVDRLTVTVVVAVTVDQMLTLMLVRRMVRQCMLAIADGRGTSENL